MPPGGQSSRTAQLCGPCSNMDLWAGEFLYTDKVPELESQALFRDFCRRRWDLCKRLENGAKLVVHFDRLESTIRLNENHPPVLTVYRGPGMSRSCHGVRWSLMLQSHEGLSTKPWPPSPLQIGLPQLPQVGSNSHYEILRHWLDDCDHNHPECKPSSKVPCLPTRLICVGTRASPALRLYEPKPSEDGRYFALSHPWGSPPHYCTFTTNIEEHKKGIVFDNLPTTIPARGCSHQGPWRPIRVDRPALHHPGPRRGSPERGRAHGRRFQPGRLCTCCELGY